MNWPRWIVIHLIPKGHFVLTSRNGSVTVMRTGSKMQASWNVTQLSSWTDLATPGLTCSQWG
jgi:hypothetical protein